MTALGRLAKIGARPRSRLVLASVRRQRAVACLRQAGLAEVALRICGRARYVPISVAVPMHVRATFWLRSEHRTEHRSAPIPAPPPMRATVDR